MATPPAPVCHISEDEVIAQPPVKQLPAIPQATDLPSALAAINAMRQVINALTGQHASGGGVTNAGSIRSPSQQQQKQGRWTEINRQTKEVKVPIDDSTDPPTVTIKRTNSITMRDSLTGEILTLKG